MTSRIEAKAGSWSNWNWKTRNDYFGNGAFFKESGSQAALVPGYKYTALKAADVPRAVNATAGPLYFLAA